MIPLTVGDKIRIRATGEAAQIIEVVDETTAKVDAFDGIIEIRASEIKLFEANDKDWNEQETIIFVVPKAKKSPAKKAVSFNEQKNQFSYEIDLHAEALLTKDELAKKSDEEILSIQIQRAKSYIEKAITFRVQRVYLIHGVGSGRLKSELHHFLREYREVKEFIHEYHKKYGMGVTEVRF